jgi:hypothetical protein
MIGMFNSWPTLDRSNVVPAQHMAGWVNGNADADYVNSTILRNMRRHNDGVNAALLRLACEVDQPRRAGGLHARSVAGRVAS